MDGQNVTPEGTSVQRGAFHEDASSPDPRKVARPPINPFARLWAMGYRRLVPIVPPQAELSPTSSLSRRPACRGKAVGICGPSGKFYSFKWQQHETGEADCERWFAMGAGVGMKTGQGLVAIDIDSLDPNLSALACAAALEILGPAPRRIGRAPKVLLPYRVSEPTGYRRVSFAAPSGKTEMVEMLGESRQFVMGGIHPGTMEPYRWPDGVPDFDALTLVSHAQIDVFFERLVEIMPEAQTQGSSKANVDRGLIDQASLTAPLHHLTNVLAAIPNGESNRKQWIDVGTALKASLPDDQEAAFDLWWGFSLRHNANKDYEAVVSEWNRLPQPPYEIGAPYLYNLASKATGENLTPAERHFDVVEEGSVDTSAFPTLPATVSQKPALQFVELGEWAEGALTAQAQPLIKGLLDQGAMSVLYGESNVGKTFVVMDMAYHIAKGLPWGGMRTTKKRVAYIAAEGGQGARKRGAALRRKYGACDVTYFQILTTSVDLLRADADVQPLIEELARFGEELGFVVVDTLSRAMAGGDENSSTDMGAIVRNLDAIRNATGAHVMVVHHSGKDRGRGARGHSLLRAATDTEIEVTEGQIAVMKQRDLEKSFNSAFELPVVTLGADEDGDSVTSCTLQLVAKRADVTPGVATPKERQILDGLDTFADTSADPGAGVLLADLVAFLGKPKSEEETVRTHLRSMWKKNLVERPGRGRWKTSCPNRKSEHDWFAPENPENSLSESGRSHAGLSIFP